MAESFKSGDSVLTRFLSEPLLSNLKRALMAAVAGEGAVMAVEAGMMAMAHSGPMASCQGPSIHEPKFLRGRLPK